MIKIEHMNNVSKLMSILNRINKEGYKAYKDIQGSYQFDEDNFVLHIDYVQSNPFASPSKVRVVVTQWVSYFPEDCFLTRNVTISELIMCFVG